LGHGLISKKELMPGVYLAESLTKAMNGRCITCIVNTLEDDINLDPLQVILEEVGASEEAMTLIRTAVPEYVASRISRLREQLRTDQLNGEERVSLVKICEEYHDIFHLSWDTLTCTTAAENSIPAPAIDTSRAMNTKIVQKPRSS
jgi:hypothetical protein